MKLNLIMSGLVILIAVIAFSMTKKQGNSVPNTHNYFVHYTAKTGDKQTVEGWTIINSIQPINHHSVSELLSVLRRGVLRRGVTNDISDIIIKQLNTL